MRIVWSIGILGSIALASLALLAVVMGVILVGAFFLIKELVTDPLFERWEKRGP